MAKKYLGEDGVAKLVNGDYSELEKIGKKLLGGEMEGADMLNDMMNMAKKYLGEDGVA